MATENISNGIITLTTDFGVTDPFVGTVKGVILCVNPAARIIDLTHNIPPQDIRRGAYALFSAYGYFPRGTVHLCVVDPDVGSDRRAMLIQTDKYYFVGPDNGLFSLVLENEKILAIRQIDKSRYMRRNVSGTFHARDIFGPVAAWITKGTPVEEFGPPIEDPVEINLPVQKSEIPGFITGEVIYIDSYGNATTNISRDFFAKQGEAIGKVNPVLLRIGSNSVHGIRTHYAEAAEGTLSVVFNSWGYLEFFLRNSNAAGQYSIRVGDKVELKFG